MLSAQAAIMPGKEFHCRAEHNMLRSQGTKTHYMLGECS